MVKEGSSCEENGIDWVSATGWSLITGAATPAVLGQYPALLPIVVLPLPQYPSSTQPCFQSNSGATPVPLPPWSPSFNCTSNATVAALQNPCKTVLHKTPQTIIFGGQFAL